MKHITGVEKKLYTTFLKLDQRISEKRLDVSQRIETNTSCSSLFIENWRGGMKYPKYPILYSKERRRDERGEREIKLSSMQKGAPFKKILKATKGAWKEG